MFLACAMTVLADSLIGFETFCVAGLTWVITFSHNPKLAYLVLVEKWIEKKREKNPEHNKTTK